MIKDRKAEELESKGLYRRAAARWAEVMMLADGDKERNMQQTDALNVSVRRHAHQQLQTDSEI